MPCLQVEYQLGALFGMENSYMAVLVEGIDCLQISSLNSIYFYDLRVYYVAQRSWEGH